ncbi:hypothetical protein TNCV_563501 [Trichonephila clavipes]|nr:hypothetical protein TNCV_563501 [Trichonephila clavipes]
MILDLVHRDFQGKGFVWKRMNLLGAQGLFLDVPHPIAFSAVSYGYRKASVTSERWKEQRARTDWLETRGCSYHVTMTSNEFSLLVFYGEE